MKIYQPIARRAGAAALALALLGTTACSDKVRVLNAPLQAAANSPGNMATTALTIGPFATNAVVMVTASGQARYLGPARNTGILVSILTPSAVAQDDSFEALSVSMVYRAATSYNFVLPSGTTRTITARTDHLGFGSAFNTATSVRMTAIALAAR